MITPGAPPLHGWHTVVTGGSGGIGGALCRALAHAGASVTTTYRADADAAHALVAALPAINGLPHSAHPLDVANSAAWATFAAAVRAHTGGALHLLVNNAGRTRFVPHHDLDALDDDLIDDIFRVNWRGAFAGVRALLPLLREGAQRRGAPSVVVNISSIAARTGQGSNVAYCASKAALDSMTRSLARALAPDVRVVSVAPGLVDGEYARRLDPAWFQAQADATPLGRLATADDVGAAVLAVAAHLPFTTGDVLPVDGGRPLA